MGNFADKQRKKRKNDVILGKMGIGIYINGGKEIGLDEEKISRGKMEE